jgi:hypothetical protein
MAPTNAETVMGDYIVFLVYNPGQFIENVIVEARNREYAKSHASHILGGDPEKYIVEPITKSGSRTVFLLGGR